MFERVKRTEKIIQFGEGAFLRGFVDWVVQLTNEATDFDASVVVVQPIANGLCQKLEEQNCVYTQIMRGMKDGETVVEISKLVRPGAAVSGSVKFASGVTAEWFLDQMGRLGLDAVKGGEPTREDIAAFQQALQKEVEKMYGGR